MTYLGYANPWHRFRGTHRPRATARRNPRVAVGCRRGGVVMPATGTLMRSQPPCRPLKAYTLLMLEGRTPGTTRPIGLRWANTCASVRYEAAR